MARRSRCSSTSAKTKRARWSSPTKSPTLAGNNSGWSILQGRNVLLMSKQNPIRPHAATRIRHFSDRLLAIAALATTRNLLLGEPQVLPILNIKVELLPFYVIAPLLYFVFHFYVLMMLA